MTVKFKRNLQSKQTINIQVKFACCNTTGITTCTTGTTAFVKSIKFRKLKWVTVIKEMSKTSV